mmetsp:Transcript_20193/g.36471  ORF Transcript_20193/g.36471 Transcript_20193/m.36471 type:complete len:264 (-) Transcript_20193:124-915(-)
MKDPTLNHECYYSLSKVGSFLPRHMDERHEEMKGAQGWLLPSRRSLSWLIYLSEPSNWDIERNGGALRTFPPKRSTCSSTHEENLQIGWIHSEDGSSRGVYLDSFFLPPPPAGASIVTSDSSQPLAASVDPHCILYCVDQKGNREYLTRPWLTEALQGMAVPDFILACAQHDSDASQYDAPSSLLLFQTPQYASRFSLIEDRQAWNNNENPKGSVVEDISPVRGRLVVFDSVQLPHEVAPIKSGTRRALAGWFHEKTQELQFY